MYTSYTYSLAYGIHYLWILVYCSDNEEDTPQLTGPETGNRLEPSNRSGTEAGQVGRDPMGSVAGKRVGFVPETGQPRVENARLIGELLRLGTSVDPKVTKLMEEAKE